MPTDNDSIRATLATWITAVNAGDLACLHAMMTDDALFLNPGGAPLSRQDFGPKFTSAHREFVIQCVSELEEVVVVGSVAYTRARDSLSVTPRAGGPATYLAGYRLSVYRKESDGRWLLARDAHTLTPTP